MIMREILFRGKRCDNGEWVQGYYIRAEHHWHKHGIHKDWITLGASANGGWFALHNKYAVKAETVGQFTGLTDKNGKKIFEGDVIKFHKYRGEPDWVGVVKYEHCLYMVAGTMPLAYEKRIGEDPYFCPFEVQLSGIEKNTIEIIGNIHDNPELLGGASNE
jgi:uncharacterized phage protein (TIGR01671 family)